MKTLKTKDYEAIKMLINHTQHELIGILSSHLKKHYDKVITTKEYVIAKGDIPIALVAHLDTVFDKHRGFNKELFYDPYRGVLFCPDGAGFDDKAGVYAILQIIKSGLRPSIIFTTDEETGGGGATRLAKENCPLDGLKYIIELDRHGSNDCVFYNCYNPKFTEYIEAFGFIEKIGSFSDISILCPAWKICGVNLSIGYQDEHTYSEILWVNDMFSTIAKVIKMLQVENIPHFEFQSLPLVYPHGEDWWSQSEYDNASYYCSCCNKIALEYELFPVKAPDGRVKLYCPDCVVGNVNWCEKCKEPYEIIQDGNEKLCQDCATEERAKVDV